MSKTKLETERGRNMKENKLKFTGEELPPKTPPGKPKIVSVPCSMRHSINMAAPQSFTYVHPLLFLSLPHQSDGKKTVILPLRANDSRYHLISVLCTLWNSCIPYGCNGPPGITYCPADVRVQHAARRGSIICIPLVKASTTPSSLYRFLQFSSSSSRILRYLITLIFRCQAQDSPFHC